MSNKTETIAVRLSAEDKETLMKYKSELYGAGHGLSDMVRVMIKSYDEKSNQLKAGSLGVNVPLHDLSSDAIKEVYRLLNELENIIVTDTCLEGKSSETVNSSLEKLNTVKKSIIDYVQVVEFISQNKN